MAKNTKDRNLRFNKINRPILSLLMGLGFLSVILLITMLTATGGKRNPQGINSQNTVNDNKENVDDTSLDAPVIAIVKDIDNIFREER